MTFFNQRCWVGAYLVCALGLLAPASARQAAALPAEVQQAAGELSLRGQGRLRVWGFEVYDATLWAAPGREAGAIEAGPLALELHYLRDFSARDLAQRSIKEMRLSGEMPAEREQRWLEEMLRVFPDVRAGERLLGVHRPGVGASFWLNGRFRGEVRDPEFAQRFFGIWLSPKTSQPGLRRALLGQQP